MKKITLFVEAPFTQRDHDRFGVEILSRHFTVEVLDLTAWINPHVWKQFASVAWPFAGYRSIASLHELQGALQDMPDVAFDYLARSAKADMVRDMLKAGNALRAIDALVLLPPLPPKSFLQKLYSLRFRTHKALVLKSWILRAVLGRFKKSRDPDIALVSGTASTSLPGVSKARQIWAHSFDYDNFLKHRHLTRPERPYAVYTDEDCAFHSDFAHDRMKPLVRAENFYPALMRFFAQVERETGLQVVIAAHPRSRWDLHGHYLEGRVPVLGKTAELIAGASLVFAHASTSISYAVLFRVPLALLTSNEMDQSAYEEELAVRGALFGVKPINIDNPSPLDPDALLRMNPAAYDEYREKYIKKSGTPDMPCWEIFADQLFHEK